MTISIGKGATLNLLTIILSGCVSGPTQVETPATLSPVAIGDCRSSIPNVEVSPHAHFISTDTGYQNAAGTIFTNLPVGGKVILDQEFVRQDGSLGPISLFWYLEGVFGQLVVEGQRLDSPSPELKAEFDNSSRTREGPTGPQWSRATFPSEGCWEITGSTDDTSLTFVMLVIVKSSE